MTTCFVQNYKVFTLSQLNWDSQQGRDFAKSGRNKKKFNGANLIFIIWGKSGTSSNWLFRFYCLYVSHFQGPSIVQRGSIVLSSSSASLVITIYDIRIRPYDLWACTFSLHVQKREGRAVGYLLLAPHQRQRHRRDTGHRAAPAVCSWRI